MPHVKESTYLLEKYGSSPKAEESMVALARRLSLKHAAPFPATLPSARGPEAVDVKIPPNPVPVFIDPPEPKSDTFSGSEYDPDAEVATPKLNPNFGPMSLDMMNHPKEDHERVTIKPEQLTKLSPFKTKLITALESMSAKNVITPLHKHRLIQEIQRATHDAHVTHIWQTAKEELIAAELHAIEYAEKMREILKSIA